MCPRCGEPSARKVGNHWLCATHYRFWQMTQEARRRGKTVPTYEQLQTMVPPDMACRDCGEKMHWLGADGHQRVVTLQHYRSGSMALVCKSCNTRHSHLPGDLFVDLPADHWFCNGCKQVLPLDSFGACNGASHLVKKFTKCKKCAYAAFAAYREANLDLVNEKRRAKRAAARSNNAN